MSWRIKYPENNSDASAKPVLIEIGEKVLRTCNAPLSIDLIFTKINLLNKLKEEINKLPEETAQQALKEIKEALTKWHTTAE